MREWTIGSHPTLGCVPVSPVARVCGCSELRKCGRAARQDRMPPSGKDAPKSKTRCSDRITRALRKHEGVIDRVFQFAHGCRDSCCAIPFTPRPVAHNRKILRTTSASSSSISRAEVEIREMPHLGTLVRALLPRRAVVWRFGGDMLQFEDRSCAPANSGLNRDSQFGHIAAPGTRQQML